MMPRFRKKTRVGDVIKIPGDGDSAVLCTTLFSSEIYKDLILLAIFPNDAVRDLEILPSSIQSLVYTSAAPIASGRWSLVDRLAVPLHVADYSMRISAGAVWCEDERLREATQKDRGLLPVMDCAGMTLVEAYISFLQTEQGEKKYFTKNRQRFEKFLSRFDEVVKLRGTLEGGGSLS